LLGDVAASSTPPALVKTSRPFIACLHVQNNRGFFGGPAFIQPIRAIKKIFKSSDWLEKSLPSKKPLLFWSCKQPNNTKKLNSLIIQKTCAHDQNMWLFWRAGFYPPIRAI